MYTWMEFENADVWDKATFNTIEECVDEAKQFGHKIGETIYVGECEDVRIDGIDLSSVLEDVEQYMCEQVGEVAEDWDISSIKEKGTYEVYEERLRELIISYIKEIGEEPNFYKIVNINPVVID